MQREHRLTNGRGVSEAQQFLFEGASSSQDADLRPGHSKRQRKPAADRRHSEREDCAAIVASVVEALMARLSPRLVALERAVLAWHEELQTQRTVKEFYTTAEVAQILRRRPYTVREWCRLGRIHAEKAHSGRGLDDEWRVSHEELVRIQNEGLLAIEPHAHVAAPKRLAK